MPPANGPLGCLIKGLGAAPAPRHYPPTKLGQLSALALRPLPKPAPPAAIHRRRRAGATQRPGQQPLRTDDSALFSVESTVRP